MTMTSYQRDYALKLNTIRIL